MSSAVKILIQGIGLGIEFIGVFALLLFSTQTVVALWLILLGALLVGIPAMIKENPLDADVRTYSDR